MANMREALSFDDHLQLLTFAMGKVQTEGLILEFGVHQGETVNHIANFFGDRTVYGLDSFKGLKEDWRGHHNMVAGTFDLGGIAPRANANVEFVTGWFDESLPGFLARHENSKIAFMHVDSDTYEAAKTIFGLAGRRLAQGSVVVFDEYLNYRGWRIGEFKAWQDFCEATATKYEYLGFSLNGEQVAVRIL
jgi:hypothetical protein